MIKYSIKKIIPLSVLSILLFSPQDYLLSENLSVDLVDTLVREKFMYGKKGEVLISTND